MIFAVYQIDIISSSMLRTDLPDLTFEQCASRRTNLLVKKSGWNDESRIEFL